MSSLDDLFNGKVVLNIKSAKNAIFPGLAYIEGSCGCPVVATACVYSTYTWE
jgi:hypothetical protein